MCHGDAHPLDGVGVFGRQRADRSRPVDVRQRRGRVGSLPRKCPLVPDDRDQRSRRDRIVPAGEFERRGAAEHRAAGRLGEIDEDARRGRPVDPGDPTQYEVVGRTDRDRVVDAGRDVAALAREKVTTQTRDDPIEGIGRGRTRVERR